MRRHQCIEGVLGAVQLSGTDDRPDNSFDLADAPVKRHRRNGLERPGGPAIGGYRLLATVVKSVGRRQ